MENRLFCIFIVWITAYLVVGMLVGYSILDLSSVSRCQRRLLYASAGVIVIIILQAVVLRNWFPARMGIAYFAVYLVGVGYPLIIQLARTNYHLNLEKTAADCPIAWLTQVTAEIRQVRHPRVVLGEGCASPECRDVDSTENHYVDALAWYVIENQLVALSMDTNRRLEVLQRL